LKKNVNQNSFPAQSPAIQIEPEEGFADQGYLPQPLSEQGQPLLIDQSIADLEEWLEAVEEAPYRAGQILHWVRGLTPISEMNDLSASLRQKLQETFQEGYPELVEKVCGGEGEADRFLFRLQDGECVEAVRIGEPDGYTACLSTQIGCGIRCSFCASGKFGLVRNLTAGEILSQVYALTRETSQETGQDGWPRHLVYMGMGEPFQNYSATLESINRLVDAREVDFGSRRITISTAGMVPEIYRFADEKKQIGLAVSLHAPNSDLRASLMPIEEIFPIARLLKACRYYIDTTGRRLTFEYVLLAGINDSPKEARRLVELFKDWPLVHINLIRYNPIGLTRLRSTSYIEAQAFLKRLVEGGLNATLRRSPGNAINAACGQLRGREYEKAGVRPKVTPAD
jgi:23S rRNA (adenine2503-C2)-methyltransferase